MDAAPDEELAVSVLGPLRAFAGEREVELGPPLQRALFAVLVLRNNHVVYRSELIDALWGEELPNRPEGGVHTYVAGLRRAFEPGRGRRSPGRVIESRGSGYLLRAASDAIDLARFERYVEMARAAATSGDLPEANDATTKRSGSSTAPRSAACRDRSPPCSATGSPRCGSAWSRTGSTCSWRGVGTRR